ncbi:MAG TPA: DUF72 domain-containing protein [Acidimicrobiales bacterium]|jgi:uncharacterized protein YecE (DUF72 family)|nr:DUF72 domain-containing protein [Acidimicrobiales bacterium]
MEMGPVLRVAGAEVRTGTCSWTDPTLVKGTWYPRKSMSAAERLAFYASRFPVVEVDSTYYWPPTPKLSQDWVERTPPAFVMDVKAYSLLTGHPTRRESLWEDLRDAGAEEHRGKRNVYADHLPPDAVDEAWARFRHALAPLRRAGKLGGVLLQYPGWFTPNKDNRQALTAARRHLPDDDVYVELRSPRWWATAEDRDRTLGVLRDAGLVHVVVDAPPASGLPAVVAATAGAAVVRFHGRNDDTWDRRDISAAERFNYLYRRDELAEWVPRLEELAARVDRIHALMNNCHGDKGVRNAADLAELLGGAGR